MNDQETTDRQTKLHEAVNLLLEWFDGCQVMAFAEDGGTTVSFWEGGGNLLARERLAQRWLIRQDEMVLGLIQPGPPQEPDDDRNDGATEGEGQG